MRTVKRGRSRFLDILAGVPLKTDGKMKQGSSKPKKNRVLSSTAKTQEQAPTFAPPWRQQDNKRNSSTASVEVVPRPTRRLEGTTSVYVKKQALDPTPVNVGNSMMDSTWFFPVGSKVVHRRLGKGTVLPPPLADTGDRQGRRGSSATASKALLVYVEFDNGEKRRFSATGSDLAPALF